MCARRREQCVEQAVQLAAPGIEAAQGSPWPVWHRRDRGRAREWHQLHCAPPLRFCYMWGYLPLCSKTLPSRRGSPSANTNPTSGDCVLGRSPRLGASAPEGNRYMDANCRKTNSTCSVMEQRRLTRPAGRRRQMAALASGLRCGHTWIDGCVSRMLLHVGLLSF